jgi:hypothetical protein
LQEDALSTVVKKGGGGFAIASLLKKGSKFGGLDVKRVYFGYLILITMIALSS